MNTYQIHIVGLHRCYPYTDFSHHTHCPSLYISHLCKGIGRDTSNRTLRLHQRHQCSQGYRHTQKQQEYTFRLRTWTRQAHTLVLYRCTNFKLLLLTWKTLNGLAPSYIPNLLDPYQPVRALRTSKITHIHQYVYGGFSCTIALNSSELFSIMTTKSLFLNQV